MRRRAFTLIELLTVMAITGILLTLIVLPVFQSFNLTRAAQAFVDAQEKARTLTERISREISNAASVRENRGLMGSITLVVPGRDRNQVDVTLPWAKLDMIKVAEGDPARFNGAFVNPITGKADPTQRSPRGQVQLPVTAGMTLVRYFVGLREPLAPNGSPNTYNNPYDGLLMALNGERDNLFVLYRAELPIYDYSTGNLVDEDGNGVPDFFLANGDGSAADLDDPAFFTILPGVDYDYVGRSYTVAGLAKARRIANWKQKAQIMTEVSRYDMVLPNYNRATRQVIYDGNRPRLLPLLQMRPSRVSAEPLRAMVSVRLGEEADGGDQTPPTTYRAKYGLWSSATIKTLPEGWNPTNTSLNEFQVGHADYDGQAAYVSGFSFFMFDPDVNDDEQTDGIELFDGNTYENESASGERYPFTEAILESNDDSNWLSNPRARSIFAPYRVMRSNGELRTDFGIQEVGQVPTPNPAVPTTPDDPNSARANLPTVATGPALTPATDLAVVAGVFSDADYASINRKFNKIWNDYPQLRPEVHRFIDLRVAPQEDGSSGPLHPITGFAKARIVPGSEEVWGPDQLPGENFGREIRYTRTTRKPGPNQYRINYTDQAEPTDYSLIGFANPPAIYSPTNFVSAVIQPRYKAGYLELNSDPNVPLAGTMQAIRATDGQLVNVNGRIRVSYRFSFASPRDIVSVDYDSRQLMSILLTIRNYPQSNIPNPQTVTLKATATVRNFIR
ncbi:MAG: pilus assembly FimT family protein [Fimbriimonas sp.]